MCYLFISTMFVRILDYYSATFVTTAYDGDKFYIK
jgi:hypothetical protein